MRGKGLSSAIAALERVIQGKMAVPFRKFMHGGTGHKPKLGPGRYPINVCVHMIKLLKDAEANASQKGLAKAKLFISAISAHKSPASVHYGRRRRKMKRAHIEVELMESEPAK